MDKLRESAFGLALGGVGLVLAGLVYVMIIGPVWGDGGLGDQERKLTGVDKKLKAFLREKVLPTKAYNERVREQSKTDKTVYDQAIAGFEARCESFQAFFNDATTTPRAAEFTADYHDAVRTLRANYWKKFPQVPLSVPEDDRTDPEKVPPFIDTVKDDDLAVGAAKIPFAMKQFWIADAVAKACVSLGIDGLEKIDVIEVREERRGKAPKRSGRGSSRKSVPRKPAPFQVKYGLIEADVTVNMPYVRFEEFLARLLGDRLQKRVPFLEPRNISMKALGESVSEFQKSVHVVAYPNEAKAREAEAAKEPKIVEPDVQFKIRLVAVDWAGVEREADKTSDEDGGSEDDGEERY